MIWRFWRLKDLTGRTTSNKTLCDKSLDIAKNPKYDGYQKSFVSIVWSFNFW